MDSSQNNSLSSRRTNPFKSASKKFSILDRMRLRRKRVEVNTNKPSALKISEPFDFRDLSKDPLSLSDSDSLTTNPAVRGRPVDSSANTTVSPLDKPLPSLPVATVQKGSPAKVTRSIIDAQEKPLRRSVSPKQETFDEWPSLTPVKQKPVDSTYQMSTQTTPSMIPVLRRRVQNLDSPASPQTGEVSRWSSTTSEDTESENDHDATDLNQQPTTTVQTSPAEPEYDEDTASLHETSSISHSNPASGSITRDATDIKGKGREVSDNEESETEMDQEARQAMHFAQFDRPYGPVLRISPIANEYLRASSPPDVGPSQHRGVSETYVVPRAPLLHQRPFDQQCVPDSRMTRVPPVEPGTPVDHSSTNAWPIRESAVAPFKTTTTPERRQAKPERLNISEALELIEPPETATTSRYYADNTNTVSRNNSDSDDALEPWPRLTPSQLGDHSPAPSADAPIAPIPIILINDQPVPASPPMESLIPRYVRSSDRIAPHNISLSTSYDRSTVSPHRSPVPGTGPVSTSKGVFKNIRGLFRKRSNLDTAVNGSSHHRKPAMKDHQTVSSTRPKSTMIGSSQRSNLPRPTARPTSTAPVPRTPTFPPNRTVRPFAASSSALSETKSSVTESTRQPNQRPKKTQELCAPAPTEAPSPASTSLNTSELNSATGLVHRLLNLVQDNETITGIDAIEKKKEIVELTKILVAALTAAHDAARASEQARMAADECEMHHLRVRREVAKAEELVNRWSAREGWSVSAAKKKN